MVARPPAPRPGPQLAKLQKKSVGDSEFWDIFSSREHFVGDICAGLRLAALRENPGAAFLS
jgi:hypothetical protein